MELGSAGNSGDIKQQIMKAREKMTERDDAASKRWQFSFMKSKKIFHHHTKKKLNMNRNFRVGAKGKQEKLCCLCLFMSSHLMSRNSSLPPEHENPEQKEEIRRFRMMVLYENIYFFLLSSAHSLPLDVHRFSFFLHAFC